MAIRTATLEERAMNANNGVRSANDILHKVELTHGITSREYARALERLAKRVRHACNVNEEYREVYLR